MNRVSYKPFFLGIVLVLSISCSENRMLSEIGNMVGWVL